MCLVFLEKVQLAEGEDSDILMADARWCGHDSRGNPTIRRDANGNDVLLDDIPIIAERYRTLMKAGDRSKQDHLGFRLKMSQVKNRVLVPKYYDPELVQHILRLSSTHNLVLIGDLVRNQTLEITTGVEVGKMAYGTGPIPFIRTSDISNWELKADPKQGVSVELYESLKDKLDVRAGDILIVRDGTYLIGTSAIVTDSDTRVLFQSHIYKIRVIKPEDIDPWLLFVCLNSPVVKRQIRAKQFTQDIIDTLGNRILEVLIPIPKDEATRKKVAEVTRETVETRALLRNKAKQIALEVEGVEKIGEEEQELLETI